MRKPRKCPKCASKKVARIMYGYPIPSAKLEADMAAGKVVLGGCCITEHNPWWRCLECDIEIFEDGTYRQREDCPEL